MIFFDNNSTTKVAPEVLLRMNEVYALPLSGSAAHQLGRQATKILDEARQNLRDLLGAQNYEVIFTGSSTEANNMVLQGSGAQKIFLSALEHSSVYGCRPKEKEFVEIAAQENGLIDVKDLEKKIPKDGNFLTAAMLANNETGAIQPVEQIAKITHQNGGLILCDIVAAAGKIDIDLEKLNVDFASISAHKLHGPQGVGALLIRKGLDIEPLIFGGKQEKSKRAGTSNVAGIAGFGEACKLAKKKISRQGEVKKLRDFLESEIKKIAQNDVRIFASESSVERVPNVSFISLKNHDNQTQLINFDLKGICVSAGAACSSGTASQSRILQAMGISKEFLSGAIRVSLGLDNNRDEVEQFIATWKEFYERTRA